MGIVIQFREHLDTSNLEAVVEGLLADIRAKRCDGLAFSASYGQYDHCIGLAGRYREDLGAVLAACNRTSHQVNTLWDMRRQRAKCTKPATVIVMAKPETKQ